mgnify:CR=1 FL=1
MPIDKYNTFLYFLSKLLVGSSKNNISGKVAEIALESAGITTNKNMVPLDERSPMVTSGIRIGTPAMTTRGMGENEMSRIAGLIDKVIRNINDESAISSVKNEVDELCQSFPLYENLM